MTSLVQTLQQKNEQKKSKMCIKMSTKMKSEIEDFCTKFDINFEDYVPQLIEIQHKKEVAKMQKIIKEQGVAK